MFASVAGIGLTSSFPPTVILCFTSFAISFSTTPGWVTLHPQTNSREAASKLFKGASLISSGPPRGSLGFIFRLKYTNSVHVRHLSTEPSGSSQRYQGNDLQSHCTSPAAGLKCGIAHAQKGRNDVQHCGAEVQCHVRSREPFCRSTHAHSEVIDESKHQRGNIKSGVTKRLRNTLDVRAALPSSAPPKGY